MNIGAQPDLERSIRGVARAALDRLAPRRPLPRLPRQVFDSPRRPTVLVLCPDYDHPSGGVRKLYRTVDILAAAGVHAYLVHSKPGFSCTWFAHNTPIRSARQVHLSNTSVVVVPETHVTELSKVPPGVSRIIFNQNGYLTFRGVGLLSEERFPYLDGSNLAAVFVVSEDSAQYLEYAFPRLSVSIVRNGIDGRIFRSSDGTPRPWRIAYMPRRGHDVALQVLNLLRVRGVLRGWEIISIDGLSQQETARALQSSSIFLSLSMYEGFGLPAAEAMASGCYVVGFHGQGGREFFHPEFSAPVEAGSVVDMARAVEQAIREEKAAPGTLARAGRAASRYVLGRYSLEIEESDTLRAFAPFLAASADH